MKALIGIVDRGALFDKTFKLSYFFIVTSLEATRIMKENARMHVGLESSVNVVNSLLPMRFIGLR